MCKIYYWNEIQPDGTLFNRQRHEPCPNGHEYAPCPEASHLLLPNILSSSVPAIQEVTPSRTPSKKEKTKVVRFEIGLIGRKRGKSKEKKPEAEKTPRSSPLLPKPWHPFFESQSQTRYRPIYVPRRPDISGAGPSRASNYPQVLNPVYPYPTQQATMVEIEPANSTRTAFGRNAVNYVRRSPPPVTREHERRPRPNSIYVHDSRRERRRSSSSYPRPRGSPPPTPREHREARERELRNRISELERELEVVHRREDIQARIDDCEAELRNLSAGGSRGTLRAAAAVATAERPRTRDSFSTTATNEPMFPERLDRTRTTVIHHQDGHETQRVDASRRQQGNSNDSAAAVAAASHARPGHSRHDSGVALVDEAVRDLRNRGERVIASAAANNRETDYRARPRGGGEEEPFVVRLLGAAKGSKSRWGRSENTVYEGVGGGAKKWF